MSCNLPNLSTELHLLIIEELLQDDKEGDVDGEEQQGEDIKTYHGGGQQGEDIKIYHHLMNWSSTSSYFRNLLAPYIFKTVKLVNNDKSATSLDALANGTRNALVKELYFISPALGENFCNFDHR
ncbi:hypothetical protein MMC31_004998 [Peltigera leucophlebia]|nr:hypothetical protein [Peltigera leucophlebia]